MDQNDCNVTALLFQVVWYLVAWYLAEEQNTNEHQTPLRLRYPIFIRSEKEEKVEEKDFDPLKVS